MTFLDMQQMRNAGSPTPSPDGRWMLYTLSTPDWQDAERQTDLYLVSMTEGAAVDEADDVHDDEERDVAGVGARRQHVLLPVEPRGAGERARRRTSST